MATETQVSIKVIEKRGVMFMRKNLIRAMQAAVDGKTFTLSGDLEQEVRKLIPEGSHKHIGSIVFNTADPSKPNEVECIVTTD
jgi:hypothetical protein